MHRRPFQGRHLVLLLWVLLNDMQNMVILLSPDSLLKIRDLKTDILERQMRGLDVYKVLVCIDDYQFVFGSMIHSKNFDYKYLNYLVCARKRAQ